MTHQWSADWYLLCWHQIKVFTSTLGQNQKWGLRKSFILNVPFDQTHYIMRWWSPTKTAAINLRGQSSWYIWGAKGNRFFSTMTWLKNSTLNWSWVFPKNGVLGEGWKPQPFRWRLRKKWFPVSSRRSPPSSFTPVDGKWFLQSREDPRRSTRKRVFVPNQSLIVGFESSSLMDATQSSGVCKDDSHDILLEIIPQHWS